MKRQRRAGDMTAYWRHWPELAWRHGVNLLLAVVALAFVALLAAVLWMVLGNEH